MKALFPILCLSLVFGLPAPQAQHARQAAVEESGLAAAMAAEDPQAFTGEVDFDRMEEFMHPWYVHIEQELLNIPHPAIRERVLRAYEAWLERTHPFEPLLEKVLQKEEEISRHDVDIHNLLFRRDPAIDARILSLKDHDEKRQAMLTIRAAYLFRQGEQGRAELLWRMVENDHLFFQSLRGNGGAMLEGKDTDWIRLFNLVAEREPSYWRRFTYSSLTSEACRTAPHEVLAYLKGEGCPELQDKLLKGIFTISSDEELLASARELLQALPDRRRRQLEVSLYWALARQDPEAAWKLALQEGLETAGGKARARAVIGYITTENPRAPIPWFLEAAAEQEGMDSRLIDLYGQELVKYDAQLAFNFAIALPPSAARDNIMRRAVASWSRRDSSTGDPEGACHAILAMRPGPLRERLLGIALSDWLLEERERAMEWIENRTEGALHERCLQVAVATRLEFEPERWEAFYFKILPEDARGSIAGSIAREWSVWDFREAFRFLREVEARRPEISVWDQWQRVLDNWKRIDPQAASEWQASSEWEPKNTRPISSSQWVRRWKQASEPGRRQQANGREDLLKTAIELPTETQEDLLARLLEAEADFPALSDALLETPTGESPLLRELADVVDLLEQGESDALLAASLRLPAPDFDWLVCRILDGYSSHEKAEAAVDALGEAVPRSMRQRASALLLALPMPGQL